MILISIASQFFIKIEIIYKGIQTTTPPDRRSMAIIQLNVGNMFDNIEHNEIFGQNRDHVYSVDEKVIEIKQVKQGILSFGAIYKNVLHWLHSRQTRRSTNINVDGCKIVFVL